MYMFGVKRFTSNHIRGIQKHWRALNLSILSKNDMIKIFLLHNRQTAELKPPPNFLRLQ